jgi:hypothetical protein
MPGKGFSVMRIGRVRGRALLVTAVALGLAADFDIGSMLIGSASSPGG